MDDEQCQVLPTRGDIAGRHPAGARATIGPQAVPVVLARAHKQGSAVMLDASSTLAVAADRGPPPTAARTGERVQRDVSATSDVGGRIKIITTRRAARCYLASTPAACSQATDAQRPRADGADRRMGRCSETASESRRSWRRHRRSHGLRTAHGEPVRSGPSLVLDTLHFPEPAIGVASSVHPRGEMCSARARVDSGRVPELPVSVDADSTDISSGMASSQEGLLDRLDASSTSTPCRQPQVSIADVTGGSGRSPFVSEVGARGSSATSPSVEPARRGPASSIENRAPASEVHKELVARFRSAGRGAERASSVFP